MIICASASIALLIVIGIYTIKSFKKNYKFEIEELVLLLVPICVNLTFMMIFKIHVFKMNIDGYNQVLNEDILNTFKVHKLNTIVNYILFIVEGIERYFIPLEVLLVIKIIKSLRAFFLFLCIMLFR